MSRIFSAVVAAALALPVLALAALIGEQEAMLSGAAVVNVPVRGYDPRDLLHGHYIQGQLDWEWEREPAAAGSYAGVDGAACVLAADAPKPRLRFIAGWKAGDRDRRRLPDDHRRTRLGATGRDRASLRARQSRCRRRAGGDCSSRKTAPPTSNSF